MFWTIISLIPLGIVGFIVSLVVLYMASFTVASAIYKAKQCANKQ